MYLKSYFYRGKSGYVVLCTFGKLLVVVILILLLTFCRPRLLTFNLSATRVTKVEEWM